eukprot:CAMPEP_0183337118 /NCGR_PEP_ID=MMETSP0164_2-20130417/4894_1 /TAXON_ID=221442 /ORGANISM="Coccolithus pelagicus ssp braarudi, Strain PLY182g" /LENGTH=108 /DNA_ID=CAMNT_0025506769 /DNA_START=277 /DNA_END=604 /DNA_ORIENTATION=+
MVPIDHNLILEGTAAHDAIAVLLGRVPMAPPRDLCASWGWGCRSTAGPAWGAVRGEPHDQRGCAILPRAYALLEGIDRAEPSAPRRLRVGCGVGARLALLKVSRVAPK